MPNIDAAFKREVTRVARREVKQALEPLRKHVAAQRKAIAALKTEATTLRSELARMAKRGAAHDEHEATPGEPALRAIPAKHIRALRLRHGLSQERFALLLGVSALTQWNWEAERSAPRAASLAQLHELRGLSKAQVAERIAAVEQAPKRRVRRSQKHQRALRSS